MLSRSINTASSAHEAVHRIFHDSSLENIHLHQRERDEELDRMLDRLIEHPYCVFSLRIADNVLSKKLCVKIAQFVAKSPSIGLLNVASSDVDSSFLFAIAAALQTNRSLQYLFVYQAQTIDIHNIDNALIDALRINPIRPMFTFFGLYHRDNNEYARLKVEAERQGHPTLQMLLVGCYLDYRINRDSLCFIKRYI